MSKEYTAKQFIEDFRDKYCYNKDRELRDSDLVDHLIDIVVDQESRLRKLEENSITTDKLKEYEEIHKRIIDENK